MLLVEIAHSQQPQQHHQAQHLVQAVVALVVIGREFVVLMVALVLLFLNGLNVVKTQHA
jgi:hypothetical protein